MDLRKKLFWISVLYFAEGFPFGVAYDVWPVYFRQHGVELRHIGLMSLLFFPYTLKPAWAPILDRIGSRQSWIAACEVGLGIAALAWMWFDPSDLSGALIAALLLFTLLSATQDIAIDAYAVEAATKEDMPAINGFRVSAYRVALLVGGGGLLMLVNPPAWLPFKIGWDGMFVSIALICFLMAAVTFASPRIPRTAPDTSAEAALTADWGRRGVLIATALLMLGVAWSKGFSPFWLTLLLISGTLAMGSFLDPSLLRWALTPRMLPVLAFGVLFKVGDAALGRMVKPFWVDRGHSEFEIGLISTNAGIFLTIAGSLLGAWIVTRVGLFRSLLYLGLAQCLSNFGYVAVAVLDLSWIGMYSASMLESFCQGLGTTAFTTFLMSQCDRDHAASQFAVLSASFALSRDVVGAFSGFGVEAWGFAAYFAVTALLALPALALLPLLRSRISAPATTSR